MRKLMALILCLCLGAVPLAAQAAKLVGESSSWTAALGEVKPYSTDAQSNAAGLRQALDNDASTCWSYITWSSTGHDDVPEATFYFSGETISDIWVRAGNQASYDTYYNNAFPENIRVRIWRQNAWLDYTYALDDYFQPGVSNQDWQDGYQRLALPSPEQGVTRVEFFIFKWRNGNVSTYNVCVSDVLFTSQAAVAAPLPYPGENQPGYAGQDRSYGNGVEAALLMRMATRSGPSTNYDGLGSYFKEGDLVKVLTKAYDKRNGIWWVQTEFKYQGTPRRAYTGVKRVDVNLDLIPEETEICTATVNYSTYAYYGPGESYSRHKDMIPSGTTGVIYNIDNGFGQLEFQNGNNKRRVWIPMENLITQ